MTLTAPEHLRGKMTNAPADLRVERDAWIAACHNEGRSQAEMAAALGVDQSTLSTAMRNAGLTRRLAPPVASRLSSMGLRLGPMDRLYDSLPPELRSALAFEAARMRGTIGDAIAMRLAGSETGAGGEHV